MEFKKFSSLENTYRQSTVDKIVYEALDQGKWIATEKVHGANFSFWFDGVVLKVASRTQFVDGTFYDCQGVIDKYSNNIKEGYFSRFQLGTSLVIYGELFGKGIQKEVIYGDKDFIAFDVCVDGEPVDYDTMKTICSECGIPVVPVLGLGTFKDMLKIDNTFRSLLTPEGFEGDNTAEGLAISPVTPKWFSNGSRVWLKNKTSVFSEKKNTSTKTVVELPEEINALTESLLEYATTNRVNNVLSKVGNITNKDFGRVLGLTIQDMLEEYEKDFSARFKDQTGEHYSKSISIINKQTGNVVRKVFLAHLE